MTTPVPAVTGAGGAPARARSEFAPVGATHPRSREHVHARTRELAVLAGRDPLDVTQDDYEQAKREVTGEAEPDRQVAMLDAAPPADARPYSSGPARTPPDTAALPARRRSDP